MKSPRGAIERFCYKHPYFGVPHLMKYVAIGNAVFWLLGMFSPATLQYLTFSPAAILRGQIWRLISFALYPPSTSLIALISIYFYYFLGTSLEGRWGTAQFNVYFFLGVILTEVYGFLTYFITGASVALNAQYIYLSMFFSFAVMFPDLQVLLFFVIPVKMKWLAVVDAAFFAYDFARYFMVFAQTHYVAYLIFAFLPVVAVLNFLLFCWSDLRRAFPGRRSAPQAKPINFKRESERIRRQQQANLYRHKCAVCGRTDQEYPNLEFRYCSQCQGYHCFCQDHIYSHVHFKE